MTGTEGSALEDLRELAIKLNLPRDNDAVYVKLHEMCQEEIAFMINKYYQDKKQESLISVEDGKDDQDKYEDSKEELEVWKELSALEMLPNEVFEKILNYLKAVETNNLRLSCKGLYDKTTKMDPRYKFWSFKPSKGTPPNFALLDEKKFCLKVIVRDDLGCNHDGNLINRYAHRICELTVVVDIFEMIINTKGLMVYLKNMKPAEFPYLTSLCLFHVEFDNDSLLQLSPQLETLKLFMVGTNFDLSTVSDEDLCFTKLKTLCIQYCNIDHKKIVSKCSKILEYLAVKYRVGESSVCYNSEFTALKHLDMDLDDDYKLCGINLLAKSCSQLKTLIINGNSCDFSDLLEQNIGITRLCIDAEYATNIEGFLNKCPLIQDFKLLCYEFELKEVKLEYLTTLELKYYYLKCLEGVLKQGSKCSPQLSFLKLSSAMEDFGAFSMDDLPAIPKLDTVWVKEDEGDSLDVFDEVNKIFPADAQVQKEVVDDTKIVFRRVYNLTEA